MLGGITKRIYGAENTGFGIGEIVVDLTEAKTSLEP